MDAKTHWEKVYSTKAPEALSWYRAHLDTSVALIERAVPGRSASIIRCRRRINARGNTR